MTLSQKTNYPWEGDIQLTVDENKAGEFSLRIRIPGWVQNSPVPSDLYTYADGRQLGYSVKVNGEDIVNCKLEDGYLAITRKWKKGDKVDIHFDMESRLVKAHAKVEADRGRIAVERGPLVYCAEFPDNPFDLGSILLNQRPEFKTGNISISNRQLTTLETEAQVLSFDEQGKLATRDVQLKMIPYFAWNHRGRGRMMVWLPWELSAAKALSR